MKTIDEFKNGKFVIITDPKDRENEADIVLSAEHATPDKIAFMINNTSGILCVPMSPEIMDQLRLPPMVAKNTDRFTTPFSVSVDHKDCGSGVSAKDRCITVRGLADPKSAADDFNRPGHVFPLRARKLGVMERMGHTEAAVDLARLAGKREVVVIGELMNKDGTMMRQVDDFARENRISVISINDIKDRIVQKTQLIEKVAQTFLPTRFGTFKTRVFKDVFGSEIIVLSNGESNLVRVHSECMTGETFFSERCDCRNQLAKAMEVIGNNGGHIIYLFQEGRGIGLANKLKAYSLQDTGLDTYEANHALGFKDDHRDYWQAAQVLKELGLSEIELLTNNPDKIAQLTRYGIKVTRVAHEGELNESNKEYLKSKSKHGHLFSVD